MAQKTVCIGHHRVVCCKFIHSIIANGGAGNKATFCRCFKIANAEVLLWQQVFFHFGEILIPDLETVFKK